MPWGTSVHSLETTKYKFYPLLTPTTQKVKNVIPLPLHRNVKEGLLWDIKGQKQIRIGRQDPPSNFHQPLRARSKPLKQGLQLMEEPIISCSGRNCLSPSGRKHWGILDKLAASIQAIIYQSIGPSETTRELTHLGKVTQRHPTCSEISQRELETQVPYLLKI